ncbi:hypothetical protein [Mesorhizobium sp. B2-4-15]|uniref:hypothetical protein n=1 Tax=Mesorhizobium sp. B2-4-15 TaxID=2589934 RepID=UPI0015EEE322|nr:hypothetical protein [Mesorhizobium sp. B2-4-15]
MAAPGYEISRTRDRRHEPTLPLLLSFNHRHVDTAGFQASGMHPVVDQAIRIILD